MLYLSKVLFLYMRIYGMDIHTHSFTIHQQACCPLFLFPLPCIFDAERTTHHIIGIYFIPSAFFLRRPFDGIRIILRAIHRRTIPRRDNCLQKQLLVGHRGIELSLRRKVSVKNCLCEKYSLCEELSQRRRVSESLYGIVSVGNFLSKNCSAEKLSPSRGNVFEAAR